MTDPDESADKESHVHEHVQKGTAWPAVVALQRLVDINDTGCWTLCRDMLAERKILSKVQMALFPHLKMVPETETTEGSEVTFEDDKND